MSVRLPGILSSSLAEVGRLNPTAGSLTMKMVGTSEAAMTIPEGSPAVNIHDWVSIYTGRGLAGIFRVCNVAENLKKQIDLTMLHGRDILSDSVWAAQTDFSGTKTQFLTQLLAQQTQLINGVKPWALGTCEDSATIEKSINYDRLSTLLESMEEEGSGYYFVYDQTTWPWTISYVAKPQNVASEFRLSRNIRSASITYNDADMCTRLYLSVSSKSTDTETVKKKNPEYISPVATPSVSALIDENITVSSTDSAVRIYNNAAAQAEWGIIVKTADVDTHDDIVNQHFESADAWAANFMATRAEPSVQIQIDGDVLGTLTGETWDEADIAALCQVALPDYGHTFRERVISIAYPELFRDEKHVSVSLANVLPKFSESIAQARKEATSAARHSRATARTAADAKELTTWSQHVVYQGEALDGTGVLTLYESGIDMDATGGVRIFSLTEGLQALYSEIVVNSEAIKAKIGSDALNGYLQITQLANEFGNVMVTAAGNTIASSIVTAINESSGQGIIYLNSDRVILKDGSIITASTLDARLADVDLLFTNSGYSGAITSGVVKVLTGLDIYSGNSDSYKRFSPKSIYIGNTLQTMEFLGNGGTASFTIPDPGVVDASVDTSTNTLTLTKSDGSTINFSKAAASGVTLVSGWSGGTFTVTPTPNTIPPVSTTLRSVVLVGTPTKGTVLPKTMNATFKVYYDNGDPDSDGTDTGMTPQTVAVDASPVYTDGYIEGWGKAYEKVLWPSAGTSNAYIDVGAPISTVDGARDLRRFVIRNYDNNSVVLSIENSQNHTYTDYAQFTHNKYTEGAESVTPVTVNVDKGSWGTGNNAGKITFSPSTGTGSEKNVSLSMVIPVNTSSGSAQISVVDISSPGSSSQPLSTGLSKTLTLTCGDDYAILKDGSTTVAQVPNNKSATPVTVNVDKGSWGTGSNAGKITFSPSTGTGSEKSVSLSMLVPTNTSNGNVQISIVDTASPGSASYPISTGLSKTLVLSCGDDYATVTDGGTTVAKVPNNKSAPASSASIDSIGLRNNAAGVQYTYQTDQQQYEVYVRASGTNVAQKDDTVYVGASAAFIDGRDSVTITAVERIASCAFDVDRQTARQDVRFTLSNGNTFVIHENFDAIYRAGMNGTSVDTTIEYAADLSSEGTVFDTVDEGLEINVSDIYQQGVSDATPAEKHWYVTGSGETVPIYVFMPVLSDGFFILSTKVAFYTYTPVEIVSVLSGNLSGYTKVSYNGSEYFVLSTNLTESERDLSIGHRIGIKDLTVTKTGVTMTGIYHRGTMNVTITVHRESDSSPTTVTSYYASQRDFDALVTNGSAGTYFKYLSYLSGYYASHEASVYDDTLTHKAVFEETYSDGSTETVIVAFDSYNYAAAPVRLSWEIINYYNIQDMSIPVSFNTTDGQYLTMSYTSGYNSQVVDQSESASTYIRGDVTYAYNKNYPSTMSCRFRVRWQLSNGSTEDVIVQKTASRLAAPVTQKLYVYASNGGAVRFRKSASTSGQTWGSLVPNTPVTYESGPSSSGWYTVTYDGKTGYIMSEYISETATSPSNYSYIGWLKSTPTTYIKGVYRNGYTGTGKVSIVYNNGSVQSFNVYSSAAQVNNISGHEGSVASTAKEAWSVDTRLIGYYLYIVYTDGTSTYLVVKDSNEE